MSKIEKGLYKPRTFAAWSNQPRHMKPGIAHTRVCETRQKKPWGGIKAYETRHRGT